MLLRIEHAGARIADAVEVAAHAGLRSAVPYAHLEVGRDGAQQAGLLFGEVDARNEYNGWAVVPCLADGADRVGEQLAHDSALTDAGVAAQRDLHVG